MTSLFGHLVTRFSSGPENLATEALAYILDHSPSARRVLNELPVQLGLALPELRSFRTQTVGEDASIPDLAGLDPSGRIRLLIENKFWAGLTSNQPAAYLARLPQDADGLLLFVVPQRRLHTIWADLVASAGRSQVALPPSSTIAEDLLFARLGQRVLAVTSWDGLLKRFEAACSGAGEQITLGEVLQLRGLCERMDMTGYIPVSTEELTNQEVPLRLLALARLIPELGDRAIAAGIADAKGLRPTHYWHGAGRFLKIGAAGGWVGIDHRLWARFGIGPLWVSFGMGDWGRGTAVLDAVAPWLGSNPPRAYKAQDLVAIPLRIIPHATRDVVLGDLLRQMSELHDLLKVLPSGVASPNAAPPAAEPPVSDLT